MTGSVSFKAGPRVGIVSLGCAKALVDSERILGHLRAEGYDIATDYAGADVVIVNTCGFLDSARQESLEAISEAMAENGRVVVTGCMGMDEAFIRDTHPGLLAVTGPHSYEAVVDAVHRAAPAPRPMFVDLVPEARVALTPGHYAYLKISEGCGHHCSFCIIPRLRGPLVSRRPEDVLREAERLVASGVKELLVVSQDTGAYGLDLGLSAGILPLADQLGKLGAWVRMHYVYPYPHVDGLLPLMAEGRILPYLDIPFQHASPGVLKAMRRPAHQERTLERIRGWRKICPDLAIRSTFIVGFPGETEDDFENLLDWLDEARLDRVGCFRFEAVAGAPAGDLPDQVDEEVKQERFERLMELQMEISAAKMMEKVGRVLDVLIDEVDEEGALGRSYADSPEVDGLVHVEGADGPKPGDLIRVRVTESDDYDLFARPEGK